VSPQPTLLDCIKKIVVELTLLNDKSNNHITN